MNISLSSKISRSENVIDCTIDNGMVLMSIDSGEYINMNNQASAIWKIIEQPTEVKHIVETLLKRFDVEHSICEPEVLSFIISLYNKNLIHAAD